MKIYTYSEARQHLAKLMEEAQTEGPIRIRRRDGRTFTLTVEEALASPLDVEGVDVGISREEIVELIHAGRRERD